MYLCRRNYIGIDISQEYVDICNQNLDDISNEEELYNIILNDLLQECNITQPVDTDRLRISSRLFQCLKTNFNNRISDVGLMSLSDEMVYNLL